MSTAKVASSRQQLHDNSAASNQQQLHHAKPKRKAPSRPGPSAGTDKTGNKSNTKVKRKTSNISQKEEGVSGAKARKKASPVKEEAGDEVQDRKLRRVISPRKEQYSHLLDEMVGCGDMVLLEPLTESNIIENLRKRYEEGDIYVRMNVHM